MAENADRKYKQVIDLVEDIAGADVNRDLLEVAVQAIDSPAQLPVDIEEIGGTAQSGADLLAVLNSVGNDELISRLTDSSGTQIDPLARQDTSPVTGSTSTATTDVTLTLGDYRKDVDWFVDVSGSATLTVEVRVDGGTWRTFDTVDYGSATTEVEQYSTSFAEMRASVDANLNTLQGSAKGV